MDVSTEYDRAVFDPVDRILVIGDIHGDFDKFRSVLEMARLIDPDQNWIGGGSHLVQLGDIPDRGSEPQKIIKLLQRLESQAPSQNGRVHVLIGNHDAMNVYGDLRYTNPKEFEELSGPDSQELLDALYESEVSRIKNSTPEEEWPDFNGRFKEDWRDEKPLGYAEHRQIWSPQGPVGKWILSKNAVLKIGDNLIVHAGLGPAYADMEIDEINSLIRAELSIHNPEDEQWGSILQNDNGPLWYRGLAMGDEELESEHVDNLMKNFGVRRIIIGHTPTPGIVTPRFDGRVILTDVGLSRHYGEHLACLEITGEGPFAIHKGERLNLPEPGKEAELRYLSEIELLEANNEAAQNWVKQRRNELSVH